MATAREQEISEKTGFDAGVEFDTEQEVREYFTVSNMDQMFGGNLEAEYPELADQNALNQMANDVVSERWHCTF